MTRVFEELQNKVLAKNATLMAGTENPQVVEIKCKKKYYENTMVKMESDNPCERCVHTR